MWGNMASSPGDKSPGYHWTPLTGLNNLDAKTKPDNAEFDFEIDLSPEMT